MMPASYHGDDDEDDDDDDDDGDGDADDDPSASYTDAVITRMTKLMM